MQVTIKPVKTLQGEIQVPGDKSISHRAVLMGALASGVTEIENFLHGEDCLSTIELVRALGVKVHNDEKNIVIHSNGINSFTEPENILDAGNSGTTTRLMAGILSGCPFLSVLTGDESLRSRPMKRVIQPLTMMGARIMARDNDTYAPMAIQGGKLEAVEYKTPVASAQVKSAILLAGLFANGVTTVIEPAQSRDHTERMLRYFGARLEVDGKMVKIWGKPSLMGRKINVPGDISSAVFFLVAGATVPDADLIIRNVGINPTRQGAIKVLLEMGAGITLFNHRELSGEPVADIRVRSSHLTGTEISGDLIPHLIDEIPVLALAAAIAKGKTVVRDAVELRYKETDRIAAVVKMLSQMGVDIKEQQDGFIINGGKKLCGTVCDSFGDHRMAMTAAVAGLTASGETVVEGAQYAKISYPAFFDTLNSISVQ